MEDGVINAIYLHREMESNENDFVSSSVNEQVLIALAFGGARKEMGIINNNRAFIERKLREEPFEDCSFQIGGVRIERDVEYRGYYVMGDMLVHRDNMETELRESFRISLIE